MKLKFKTKRFSPESVAIVTLACQIIEDYQAQGYRLSLRQLYYQLVARNAVPNTEQSYKRVGDIISDARLAGLCDWDMIEDRNREMIKPAHWNTPGEIVAACASQYRVDKWASQPNYCEVMVEKQALEGVLEPICNELDIPFTSNKGYSSVTMMYQAGRRILDQFQKRCKTKKIGPYSNPSRLASGEWLTKHGFVEPDLPFRLSRKGRTAGVPQIVIYYLGDHDPSGMDMTRDVADRLQMFSDFTPIDVKRLALNMPQIEELNPPENPAKMTDSRANSYVAQFGDSSWELDAVAPDALARLVREAVEKFRNNDLWQKASARENKEREILKSVSETLNRKTK